jgi:hypothetical protein
MIVAQLAKKLPAFNGTETEPPWSQEPLLDFVLRQFNSVHTFISYFSEIKFTIILPSLSLKMPSSLPIDLNSSMKL